MTIGEYLEAKEDLEVQVMNQLEAIVQAFEQKTGLALQGLEVILYDYDILERSPQTRISDVNVRTSLSEGRTN